MLPLLKTHFGYDHFRPLQEEIITHVLKKEDSLVLMPTGGGKSLCYQLPALHFSGLTLVISPLIALMKDQVDSLKANGIAAEFINSSLSYPEIERISNQARHGRLKILYVAPERLAMSQFQTFLKNLNLSLIAIDEAHCISLWGHDFRPDYRNLKSLRQDFPEVPIMALTATATPQVRQDIKEQLNLQKAKTFLSSFNRPNLSYHVYPKQNAFALLLNLLKKYQNEPTIIYCFSRKDTENLAADLREMKLNALSYHAGLEHDVRKSTQEKFIKDEVPIIVATIAFGMGIDKPDIRLIVHYDLPKSLEGYYQETGRAGRDSLPSECGLFYSYGDKMKQDFFIDKIEDATERSNARRKLNEVIEFCELTNCRRQYLLKYFGEDWTQNNCQGCDICLTQQEVFEATAISQKILSAVMRTGQRFGPVHVIDVLMGANTKKIRERGHDRLSVFGIVRDFDKDQLRQLMRQLISKKLLIINDGEYPTLAVTLNGQKWLANREKIFLAKPKIAQVSAVRKPGSELEFNQTLFEQLRLLRKQIAEAKDVPPFVIFGNESLQEMAYYLPQTLFSLEQISGVGAKKLAEFGEMFLTVIKQFTKANNLSQRVIPVRFVRKSRSIERPGSTYDETKKMFLQQLSINEIAKRRGVTEGTIINHLEKLVQIGSVETQNIASLRPESQRLAKIKAAFQKTGTANLTPVKELLGEAFSYEEIRLGRLFLAMEK